MTFLFFSGKLENWTFWAESVKNWHFSGFFVPRNGCFSLSLRCTRVGPRMTACLYLSLSISHFNLAYLDLCKFTLFDKPLQLGLFLLKFYTHSCITLKIVSQVFSIKILAYAQIGSYKKVGTNAFAPFLIKIF